MRSLFDIRLSRLSLAVIVTLSVLATVVILSGAGGRTPAETAALVALRRPTTTTKTVVAAVSLAPATTASPSPSTASGDGDSTDAPPADSAPAPAPAPSTADTTDTGDAGNTGDTGGADNSSTGTSTTGSTTTTAARSGLPKVGHVFEIALSTTGYQAAFGHAPYLRSLERKGTLLSGYRSLGSSELADNLAMISGQVPNADTRGGCMTYAEFPTAVVAKANGLVPGKGCVYPETALTLGDQVSATGHVWRAYVEGMGKQTCVHANSNAVDDLALPGAGPGYDSRHNPFIYFHSLLDLGDCATDDLDLSKLPAALSVTSKTATFSFLAPNGCGDARAVAGDGADATDPTTTTGGSSTTSDTTATTPTTGTTTGTTTTTPTTTAGTTTPTTTSANGSTTTPTTASPSVVSGALGVPTAAACPTGPVGIAAENAFLKTWVPRILRSPAYKKDGVLVIAFAGDGVKRAGPKVRTGALVLSRYAHRGRTVTAVYTPYSLLRSLEDMLRYTPLARATSAPSFATAALVKTK